MNWKPKKGVGKTLYVLDFTHIDFKSASPYWTWTLDTHCPIIVKYTNVMIITSGARKSSMYITAKKIKYSANFRETGNDEYKTYTIKKIDTINEDKQGIVLMKGNDVIISNDKKELLGIVRELYKKKEIAAKKAIEYCKTEKSIASEWLIKRVMEQPKHVMESYKNFVKKLKKI